MRLSTPHRCASPRLIRQELNLRLIRLAILAAAMTLASAAPAAAQREPINVEAVAPTNASALQRTTAKVPFEVHAEPGLQTVYVIISTQNVPSASEGSLARDYMTDF